MNSVPLVLNVLLPWFLFTVTYACWAFRQHYEHPERMPWIQSGLVAVALMPMLFYYIDREYYTDPTWYRFSALSLTFAVLAGTVTGLYTYVNYMGPYYEYQSLEVYPHVDVSKAEGSNMMDVGRVYFGSNTVLDQTKSWHYKSGKIYCVVPITNGELDHYDFWAIGTDCCSLSSSDFRCGDFDNAKARSGLRLLDKDERAFYSLAVEQASSLYGIKAQHPLFFVWSEDPLASVMNLDHHAMRLYALAIFTSFVFNITAVVAAACRFAWIGRVPDAKPFKKIGGDKRNYGSLEDHKPTRDNDHQNHEDHAGDV